MHTHVCMWGVLCLRGVCTCALPFACACMHVRSSCTDAACAHVQLSIGTRARNVVYAYAACAPVQVSIQAWGRHVWDAQVALVIQSQGFFAAGVQYVHAYMSVVLCMYVCERLSMWIQYAIDAKGQSSEMAHIVCVYACMHLCTCLIFRNGTHCSYTCMHACMYVISHQRWHTLFQMWSKVSRCRDGRRRLRLRWRIFWRLHSRRARRTAPPHCHKGP